MKSSIIVVLWAHLLTNVLAVPTRDQIVFEQCDNFNGLDSCLHGQQVDYPAENEVRRWQTPPRDHKLYKSPQWQDYRDLQGYASVQYNADLSAATVDVITFQRESGRKLMFQFGKNAKWTPSPSKQVLKSDFANDEDEGLAITVKLVAGNKKGKDALLELDSVYFVWQNPEIDAPHTNNGQKGAIVELFGWPYNDVAKECEHLGKAGYMGVKVATVHEHVVSWHYLQNGELNPWFLTYQPVSYRLQTRLGSREELRNMIVTCRRNGVRVYADAVINHMSGSGNDVMDHRNPAGGSCIKWGPKNSSSDSPYFTHSWGFEKNEFTGERPALEFPAVPYGPTDFHCERSLNSWSSGFVLNYGWLVGLTDLNTEKEYVQKRIADFMTDLMGFGFSGFRIDAAKHIRPDDLAQIFGKFQKSMGGQFTEDFISWLEVIIGGEKDLLACHDSDYNYYQYFDNVMKKAGLSNSDIAKVKVWSSDYPKESPICGYWILPASRFVIQNDDHDQQNAGSSSRDMADKGSVLVIERNVEKHRNFEKLLFERTDADWQIKLVLSSYSFMENGARGYPDGFSDCSKYLGPPSETCRSVPYSPAFEKDSCGYSMIQGGKWTQGKYTRVHRDKEIILSMRKWMGLSTLDVSNADLGLPEQC